MPIEKKDIFKTPTKSRTPKKIFRKLQYNIIGKSTAIVSNYDFYYLFPATFYTQ